MNADIIGTLRQAVFYPADVEAATGGYVNRRVQQTWKARNWFWTEIEEPLAGKPREYPLAAVYEAAIMASAGNAGQPLSLVHHAVKKRLEEPALGRALEESRKTGFSAYWPDSDQPKLDELPEFQNVDTTNPWFWIVILGSSEVPWTAKGVASVSNMRVSQSADLDKNLRIWHGDTPTDRFLYFVELWNISDIAHRVNSVLLERVRQR